MDNSYPRQLVPRTTRMLIVLAPEEKPVMNQCWLIVNDTFRSYFCEISMKFFIVNSNIGFNGIDLNMSSVRWQPISPNPFLCGFEAHLCIRKYIIHSLRPRQNGRCLADDSFKRIFLNETVRNWIKTSLKCVPKVPITNIPALIQITACLRPGDKSLFEPILVSLLTHICVTRPQWDNGR